MYHQWDPQSCSGGHLVPYGTDMTKRDASCPKVCNVLLRAIRYLFFGNIILEDVLVMACGMGNVGLVQ